MNEERYDILRRLYEKNVLPENVMTDLKALDQKGLLSKGLEALSNNDEFIKNFYEENRSPTTGEQITTDLGSGTRAILEGGAGWIGVFTDPFAFGLVEAYNRISDSDVKKESAKESMKNLLDIAGIPDAETEMQKIMKQGSEFATATLLDIATGKALSKLVTGPLQAAAKQMTTQPVQQVISSTGAGMAQEAAAQEGAGELGQTAAALAGGITSAKLAQARQVSPRTIQPGLKEAEERGIDVATSDVLRPRKFFTKSMQAAGEKIPVFGTAAFRARQYEQRLDAIKSTLRKYDADDELIDMSEDIMKELSSKRKSDLSKYTGMKNSVVQKMDTMGRVPMPNTAAKIDEEIKRLNKIDKKLNKPAVDILKSYKKSFQNKTFLNVEGVREMLGEAFTPSDLATVKKQAEKSVNKIYGAVKEDMGNFIKANGEMKDYHKWSQANKRIFSMIDELKISGLKAALKKGDVTPEIVNRLLFSHNRSEVRALYNNLNEAGRKNARTAILLRALEKSNGLENLSAEKFTSNLNRLGKSIGVFFKERELDDIKGLAKALKLTEQSARAGLHPPTGVQSTPYVITAVLADLFGGTFGGAIAGGATVGSITRAFESKPVRRILMRLPKIKKGSPEEAALVKRLIPILRNNIQNKETNQ